jgi:hypothetical protein
MFVLKYAVAVLSFVKIEVSRIPVRHLYRFNMITVLDTLGSRTGFAIEQTKNELVLYDTEYILQQQRSSSFCILDSGKQRYINKL